MAEWLVERGIGETRAALIVDDAIVEARIRPDSELAAGAIVAARLVRRIVERNQGIVAWDGGEAMVSPLPAATPEGAMTLVEIVRPPLPEPGKPKRARARPAAADAAPCPAPPLEATLDGPVRVVGPHDPDVLEAAGWSELLEEAATCAARFAQGSLTIALTPAMTLIDIDGEAAPDMLAVAGAAAAAHTIRRLDIAGSIGIDLPTVSDKGVRHAAAAAIDDALPQPFERTAVNGFGFVQIVRPRRRLSLPELYAVDPAAAHARALMRQVERSSGAGERIVTAHPDVVAAIESGDGWIARAQRNIGATVTLRAASGIAISAGHVQARHP